MNRRNKNRVYVILFFVLFCLLFVPTYTTQAYFSDTASQDTGIDLTLGTIDVVTNTITSSYTLKTEAPSVALKTSVKNNGTLSGKLAYKVFLTNEAGKPLSENLKDKIKLSYKGQEIKATSDYKILTEEILVPGSSLDVSIQVELIKFATQNETIKVHVEFLLFQTNGTISEPLFYDQDKSSYEVTIQKDNYWPNVPVKAGNFNYAIKLPESGFIYSSDKRNEEWWWFIWRWDLFHTSENYGTLYLEKTNGNFTIDDWRDNWKKVVDFTNSDMVFLSAELVTNNKVKINFKMDKFVEKQFFLESDNKERYYDNIETKIILKDNKVSYDLYFKYSARPKSDERISIQRNISVSSNITVLENTLGIAKKESQSNKTLSQNDLTKKEAKPIKQEETIEKIPKKEKVDSTVPAESEEETDQDVPQKSPKPSEEPETKELPLNAEFHYIPLKLNEQTHKVGVTQVQFDWITQFVTLDEFAAQITEETPPLYIKYDKLTGIEDIEQYVYDLAKQKELGFKIKLRTIPEEKLLEITFTK